MYGDLESTKSNIACGHSILFELCSSHIFMKVIKVILICKDCHFNTWILYPVLQTLDIIAVLGFMYFSHVYL